MRPGARRHADSERHSRGQVAGSKHAPRVTVVGVTTLVHVVARRDRGFDDGRHLISRGGVPGAVSGRRPLPAYAEYIVSMLGDEAQRLYCEFVADEARAGGAGLHRVWPVLDRMHAGMICLSGERRNR